VAFGVVECRSYRYNTPITDNNTTKENDMATFDLDTQCDESSDLSVFEAQEAYLSEEAVSSPEPTEQDWKDLDDFQKSLVHNLDWIECWAELRNEKE